MHIQKVHEDEEILASLKKFEKNLPSLKKFLNFENSKTLTVFISAPYMMPNANAFKLFFESQKVNVLLPSKEDGLKERLEEDDLLRYIGQYNVALMGDDRYTAKVIKLGAESTNKKLIGLMKWGTGIDSIDQEAAKTYNVVIKNTMDAFSEPVAESILGSILSFNRGLMLSTRLMQTSGTSATSATSETSGTSETSETSGTSGKDSWVKIPGKTLSETTFGIIGFGNVGKAITKKLLALNALSILAYDIQESTYALSVSNVYYAKSVDEVLDSNPDFLLLTCSGNVDNVRMIGKEQLRRLKKGQTVIINMARGSLIDEEALISALQGLDDMNLKGAALDVYWNEPLSNESMLRKLPNVILTSHNANSSPFYWLKVHLNTIKNTFDVLSDSKEF